MKLSINTEITESGNRIILGKSIHDFEKIIRSDKQLQLLRNRIEKEKIITVFPEFNASLILCLLKDEKEQHLALEKARTTAHRCFAMLKEYELSEITIQQNGTTKEELTAFIEGLYMSNYSFDKYITKHDKPKFNIKETSIEGDLSATDIRRMEASLEGNKICRDLVNEPLSYLTAEKFAEEMIKAGKIAGYSTEVLNKKKIESLKMGGLLAVNKGSIDPPTFTIMEWKPDNAKNSKPYVLVGKGIVFDTGGLSLKPTADSMDYMKCDMGGGAATCGAMYAIAKAKLPVHVIGLVPATDNRPDGNAYVPGDVITMHDGSSVEVLNTDAEGRLILADALSYAKKYDPELTIDLATLTGSAHMAIGKYAIVGMGNAEKDTMQNLIESGFNSFERIAEFPFWDDFSETLKSDIADQKNIGGRSAGAITAGKFLEKFTDYPYIHLDIAGPSFNKTEDNYRGKGGSGVGVRLLFDFFKKLSK